MTGNRPLSVATFLPTAAVFRPRRRPSFSRSGYSDGLATEEASSRRTRLESIAVRRVDPRPLALPRDRSVAIMLASSRDQWVSAAIVRVQQRGRIAGRALGLLH
jgi:hypothetical protein